MKGIEHPSLSLSKTPISETPSAESGAANAEHTPLDPDLAKIVVAWPRLPEHIKAAVSVLTNGEDTKTGRSRRVRAYARGRTPAWGFVA